VTSSSKQSAELMSAYLDAELPAHEAEEFESMIAGDPAARTELEELRKVMALVASLPDVEAPPDFAEKVTRRVRRKQLLAPEGALLGLVSLPFQVLSMIVILAAAALYMMAQLERQPVKIERDRAAVQVEGDGPAAGGAEPIRR
jgi:anti-sigma factor RsiW